MGTVTGEAGGGANPGRELGTGGGGGGNIPLAADEGNGVAWDIVIGLGPLAALIGIGGGGGGMTTSSARLFPARLVELANGNSPCALPGVGPVCRPSNGNVLLVVFRSAGTTEPLLPDPVTG